MGLIAVHWSPYNRLPYYIRNALTMAKQIGVLMQNGGWVEAKW